MKVLPLSILTLVGAILVTTATYGGNNALGQFVPPGQVIPPLNADPTTFATFVVRIPPGAAANDTIHFYPQEINIPSETMIAWVNGDPAVKHTVTSGLPEDAASGDAFNSGVLPYPSFFQYRFDEAGEFPYHCSMHPFLAGTVRVSDERQQGEHFDFASGTGPIFNMTEHERTLLTFKPTSFEISEDRPATKYNLTLLKEAENQETSKVFSSTFVVRNNNLQVELVPDNSTETIVSGPDVSFPLTGAFHARGDFLNETGNYTARVEVIAMGFDPPSAPLADEFRLEVTN
jgi:plastocyanin